jgi:hypothetical protein
MYLSDAQWNEVRQLSPPESLLRQAAEDVLLSRELHREALAQKIELLVAQHRWDTDLTQTDSGESTVVDHLRGMFT